MQLTTRGEIVSSGHGLSGLRAAWDSIANIFTDELPALIAALRRIAG